MKKIRLWLSALALLAAVGSTLATQYKSSSTIEGYVFIDGNPDLCVSQGTVQCEPFNGEACEIDGIEMKENADEEAQCGRALGKP